MILSWFLVSCLPFVALSWNHHREPSIVFGLLELLSLQTIPQPSPPPSPPSLDYAKQYDKIQMLKQKNPCTLGKFKRTAQPTTAPAPTTAPESQDASATDNGRQVTQFVGLNQDFLLSERLTVPCGTQITWYKNNTRLHRQGDIATEATTTVESSASSPSSSMVVNSMVFIDCATTTDGGLYRLEVTTPNSSESYHHNYTVIIVDASGVQGVTCRIGRNVITYKPRIYQYAQSVSAESGKRVVLPCRFQGLSTVFAWYHINDLIPQEDDDYELKSNGDLVIKSLSGSPGATIRYACRVASTYSQIEPDLAFTYVNIQPSQSSQT